MNGIKKIAMFGFMAVAILSLSIRVQAQSFSSYAKISGKINDASGKIVKMLKTSGYASVFAYNEGNWIQGEVFDDGRYVISNVPNGEWFLGANIDDKSGFLNPKISSPINIINTVNTGEFVYNFVLPVADGVVSGTISDNKGAKVKAVVNLIDANSGQIVSKFSKNGIYNFVAKAGQYVVSAVTDPSSKRVLDQEKISSLKRGQLLDIGLLVTSNLNRNLSGVVTPTEAGVNVYAFDGVKKIKTETDSGGNYSLNLQDGDWIVKAQKNKVDYVLESDPISVKISGGNLVQNLELKNRFDLPRSKQLNFDASKGATLSLDDGMTFSLPENSLLKGFYSLNISVLRPAPDKDDFLSNLYNVEILSFRGERVASLLKSAVVKIPFQANRVSDSVKKNLGIFYWNPEISRLASGGRDNLVVKDNFVISLTNYLAGFVVTPPSGGGSSGGGGGGGGGASQAQSVSSSGSGNTVFIGLNKAVSQPPIGFSGTNITTNGVNLEWLQGSREQGDGFLLLRGDSPSSLKQIATMTSTKYTDSTLSPGQLYYYALKYFDSSGTTSTSTVLAVKTSELPFEISNVSISDAVDAINITLITNKAANSVLNYGIKNVAENTISNPNYVNVFTFSLKKDSLKSNEFYQALVYATDQDGNRSISETLTFKPFLSQEAGAEIKVVENNLIQNITVANPAIKFIFTEYLKIGSRGEQVKQLQAILGINPTGYFGSLTESAVKGLQERNGLSATGTVGPRTRAILNTQ